MRKELKKKISKKGIVDSIPFSFTNEIGGYEQDGYLHYVHGKKLWCPTFPDKVTAFHTHIDVPPRGANITLPDMPSPTDMMVFLMINNAEMYIKTPRIVMHFTKTRATAKLTDIVYEFVKDNKNAWNRMLRRGQHERMFYFVLHYLKKDMDRKNANWMFAWKRITEQVLKMNVDISASDLKDPL
jgi:hypothetical protein